MARIGSERPVQPEDIRAARRFYQIKHWKGQRYVAKWPGKRKLPPSDKARAWMDQFGCLGFFTKIPDARVFDPAKNMAKGTGWLPRDVLAAAANGHLFFDEGSIKITTPTVSVKRTSGQVFTPNTMNVLTPNAIEWDNNNFWNAVTNPTRLTVRSSGLYLIAWNITYEAKTQAPATIAELKVNGVIINDNIECGVASTALNNMGALLWYFQDNDYLEMFSYYNPTSRNTTLSHLQLVGITPEVV